MLCKGIHFNLELIETVLSLLKLTSSVIYQNNLYQLCYQFSLWHLPVQIILVEKGVSAGVLWVSGRCCLATPHPWSALISKLRAAGSFVGDLRGQGRCVWRTRPMPPTHVISVPCRMSRQVIITSSSLDTAAIDFWQSYWGDSNRRPYLSVRWVLRRTFKAGG